MHSVRTESHALPVPKRKSLPGADEIVKLLEEHGTLVAVSAHLGVPNQTLHGHLRRLERDDKTLGERVDSARRNPVGRIRKSTMHQWPERDELLELIRSAPSMKAAAESLGATAAGLRSHCERVGIDVPKERDGNRTVIRGESAELTASELASAEELMRERGFSTEEWRVKSAIVNEWGLNAESGQPFKQLKVSLERKPDLEWIFPASNAPKRRIPRLKQPSKARSQRVCLVSDHQAPYYSHAAHNAFLRFLEQERFDRVIHAGDLVDFPSISRHRDSAVYNATAQECINSGYQVLKEIADAARSQNPDVVLDYISGNHDERIRTELLLRAERMFGLKPAEIPGAEQDDDLLSLKRLLRLDELGVTLHDNPAGYKHAEVEVSPRFVIRHGWLTGPNPAKKSMEIRGTGIAVGHTHAKRQMWVTKYVDGKARTDVAVELGTMSQTETGIGFAVLPDWHPGWATVTVHHDGLVSVDHAVFHEEANNGKGVALWRDNRY